MSLVCLPLAVAEILYETYMRGDDILDMHQRTRSAVTTLVDAITEARSNTREQTSKVSEESQVTNPYYVKGTGSRETLERELKAYKESGWDFTGTKTHTRSFTREFCGGGAGVYHKTIARLTEKQLNFLDEIRVAYTNWADDQWENDQVRSRRRNC